MGADVGSGVTAADEEVGACVGMVFGAVVWSWVGIFEIADDVVSSVGIIVVAVKCGVCVACGVWVPCVGLCVAATDGCVGCVWPCIGTLVVAVGGCVVVSGVTIDEAE
jgi:hypothetical protein